MTKIAPYIVYLSGTALTQKIGTMVFLIPYLQMATPTEHTTGFGIAIDVKEETSRAQCQFVVLYICAPQYKEHHPLRQ